MIEVIHFGLSSNKGGIESYLKRITDNITQQEIHFNFIDMTGKESRPCYYEELKQLGCDFYKITPRNVSVLQNRSDLENLFNDHHFDILHFHVNTLSYITPVEIALKHRCKVIIHSRSGNATPKFVTRLMHVINKKRIHRWPVIRVAVSDIAGRWLFGNNSKYYIFNNGIDTKRYTFSPKRRVETRKKLNNDDSYVIGHVGSFLPVKNYKLLLEVCAWLIKNDLKIVLWLIGDGPLRPSIEELASELGIFENVRFLGIRDDVQDLYSGMDLFMFPSVFEGFPNAVLEAQCEGLPCLISDSITREVDVLDKVYRENINSAKEVWANKVLQIKKVGLDENYRVIAPARMEEKGFSVSAEVKRLQNLYRSMMGNTR